MSNSIKKLTLKKLALLAAALIAFVCFGGLRLTRVRSQSAAPDIHADWRPGRDPAGVGFVGSKTCAQCHAYQASTYSSTPMAHASATAEGCRILATHPRLTFREGPYTYQITRRGAESVYTVSDGAATISAPILYCFGQGVAGQTYIFRHDGALYESRVSFFDQLEGLGLTILHPREVPKTLAAAVGRRMSQEGARGCFNCHTTGAVRGERLELERLAEGVSCEACHGPGERHVAAVKAKNFRNLQIFNPSKLDAIDLSQEFCGTCHVGFEEVMQMPDLGGMNNVRFQPYRMFKSRGHLLDDARISCVACHDPHDQLEREPAFYDTRCLACHASGPPAPTRSRAEGRTAAPCPVSTRQCTTCHMPKVELPEMHFKFTDHWIRTPKANQPTPR
jgi:Cytochrome c554 and c-prime